MGKVHKTLRIEAELAERIDALKEAGESEAAAFTRILEAGAQTLEGGSPEATETAQGGELVASLQEHIDTLKAANEELSAQLSIKDRHIETLTDITKAAQALEGLAHKQLAGGSEDIGAEPIAATPADSPETPKEEQGRRGFFARLFG